MVAAAKGGAYEIPFGGSLQLQYSADAGEAFVRASEAQVEGASVHNLDGPVASVEEIVAAIERAAPEAAGQITHGEDPLPFPAEVDSASFTELVGGPVSRPLEEGVAEAIAALPAVTPGPHLARAGRASCVEAPGARLLIDPFFSEHENRRVPAAAAGPVRRGHRPRAASPTSTSTTSTPRRWRGDRRRR